MPLAIVGLGLLGHTILLGCGENAAESIDPSPRGSGEAPRTFDDAREAPLTVRTEAGVYALELQLDDPAALRGRLHSWRMRATLPGGRPITPARLALSGGMPQHRHGFQSAPRVTEALGDGWYRVEGVRFHMPGLWTLRIEVVGDAGADVAIVELEVPY